MDGGRYSANCRLILCCQSPSKLIDPLRSRCLGIRVAAPTNDDIVSVLNKVAAKERFQLPAEFAASVAKESKRNMRRALLMLEACKVQQCVALSLRGPPVLPAQRARVGVLHRYPFRAGQKVQKTDWEVFIQGLARSITQEQSPARCVQRGGGADDGWVRRRSGLCWLTTATGVGCQLARLLVARAKLYELLVNCIPPDVVLKALVKALMPRLDDEVKHQVSHWAAFYEHRLQLGQKEIFHLEAFVAKFMAIYKEWLIRSFGDV